MEQTNYSKLSQRDVDRAETDLLINLSTLTQRGLAKMIGCHESKISRTERPVCKTERSEQIQMEF